MLLRSGLLLAVSAICLQIAVFLQPLLPEKYQISPVCETITRALLIESSSTHSQHQTQHHVMPSHQHSMQMPTDHIQHEHDVDHQCQYCTVYGNLVLPPELDVKEILDRIQIRLLAFQQSFVHVWFVLQQLFLIPQGRAPPLFA